VLRKLTIQLAILTAGDKSAKYFEFATASREVADPYRPHPCEVANSAGVFGEWGWLTGGVAKVEWGSQGCRAEVGPPAKTRHTIATGLINSHQGGGLV